MAEDTPKEGELAKDQPDSSAESKGEDEQAQTVIPDEILQAVPKERRKEFQSIFAAMAMGPFPSPIAQKVTPEHIGRFIEASARETELEYEDRKDTRRWTAYGIWTVVALIGGLLVFLVLQDEDSLVETLLQFGAGGLGGFGTGYGVAQRRRR